LYVRRICVDATAERKLAKRAGEAVGAATGGDCDRATCRRCNNKTQHKKQTIVLIVTKVTKQRIKLQCDTQRPSKNHTIKRKTIKESKDILYCFPSYVRFLVALSLIPTNDVSLVVPHQASLPAIVQPEKQALTRCSHHSGLRLSPVDHSGRRRCSSLSPTASTAKRSLSVVRSLNKNMDLDGAPRVPAFPAALGMTFGTRHWSAVRQRSLSRIHVGDQLAKQGQARD